MIKWRITLESSHKNQMKFSVKGWKYVTTKKKHKRHIGYHKRSNICVIGVPEGKARDSKQKQYLRAICSFQNQ